MYNTYASVSVGEVSSFNSSTGPVKIIPLHYPSTTTAMTSSSSSFSVVLSRWSAKVKRMTWMEWIELILPCYRWINTYRCRSFSRFAVNHESGAKTGLSGIIMGCAIQFLTPLFEYIPQCAPAAIVISAVIGLVSVFQL